MNFGYVTENGVNSNVIDRFLYCWYKKEIVQLFGYEQVAKRIANIRLTRIATGNCSMLIILWEYWADIDF